MATYKLGNIEELYISKEDIKDRLSQSEIVVDEDGVFIDKFYGKNPERSILITSTEAYDLIEQNHLGKVPYGKLGENILVDFPLHKLKEGDKIQIGKVVLQITRKCTLCDHLSEIHEDVPALLKDHRGIFAKALEGGIIQNEDPLYNIGSEKEE
jgi:MOSC domain-containing protein YiiM